MPAGLQIFNNSNTIVVDELYQNFMLVSSGQITTVSSGDTYPYYSASFSTTHQNPQVFFTNTGTAYISPFFREVSGSTTTLHFFADKEATFNYKMFATGAAVLSGTHGLQVFDASGTIVFDSSNKFLRINSVIQTSGTSAASYPYSAPGRTIAAELSFTRFSVAQIADNPFPILGRFVDSIQVTSTAINTKQILFSAFPGQPDQSYPPQTSNPPQIVLADVTNF